MGEQLQAKMVKTYEAIAEELETAARHCRVAAGHLKQHDVPRACAHGFAAHGQIGQAHRRLGEVAEAHARLSSTE